VGRDAKLSADVLERVGLSSCAQHDHVDPELVTARLGDRALLTRDERRLEPGEPGERDRHAVARVEELQLVPPLREHHPSVGEHSIDVGD